MVLEIGDVPAFRVLAGEYLFGLFDGGVHAAPHGNGEISASGVGAEDASAGAFRPVPVGTGESAVQRQLVYLASEGLLQITVQGIIVFQRTGAS